MDNEALNNSVPLETTQKYIILELKEKLSKKNVLIGQLESEIDEYKYNNEKKINIKVERAIRSNSVYNKTLNNLENKICTLRNKIKALKNPSIEENEYLNKTLSKLDLYKRRYDNSKQIITDLNEKLKILTNICYDKDMLNIKLKKEILDFKK